MKDPNSQDSSHKIRKLLYESSYVACRYCPLFKNTRNVKDTKKIELASLFISNVQDVTFIMISINQGLMKIHLTSNTGVLAWHASHLAKLFQFGNINESLQTNVSR